MKKIDEVSPHSLFDTLQYSNNLSLRLSLHLSCPFSFIRTSTLIEFSFINFTFDLIINLQLSIFHIFNFESPYNGAFIIKE